jgi:hypothetical protein
MVGEHTTLRQRGIWRSTVSEGKRLSIRRGDWVARPWQWGVGIEVRHGRRLDGPKNGCPELALTVNEQCMLIDELGRRVMKILTIAGL